MRQRFYRFFVINVTNWLYVKGHDIVHDTPYGITFDLNVEKIIIPKFNIGFIQIFFVKNNKIVDKFIATTKYRKNAEKQFKRYYKKRMFKTLKEIDNL